MDLKTFIFIGQSGSGKGTQAKLLIEELKRRDQATPIFYLETGDQFRKFIANPNYTSELSKKIMDVGGLQPTFLAIHMWSHLFIENLSGKEHLVIDGTPRKLDEAKVLDESLNFYGREKPIALFIKVSREWSIERLLGRGRADDIKIDDINRRLDWFEKEVYPAVEHYRNSNLADFYEINGEQTIEKVHQEIFKKIF